MIYIEDIIEELKKEGYVNKSIDYAEFKKIYEKYQKYYSEKEFAEILGIGYSNYKSLKSGRSNARILKFKLNEVPEGRKKEIVEELIKKGYKEKSINYEKFKELYEPYEKEMIDKEFAEMLGVKYGNYMSLKSGRSNARILKEKSNEVPEERKKEIVEKLIGEGYKGKSISYEKFKELYEPYEKEMVDKEFAEILGVKYGNYMALKSGRRNARILKEKAKGVPEERKKEIVEELIGKGFKGESISYEKFKELYKPYEKEMVDKEFAEILGVKYGNYMVLKSGRSNAKILKEKSNEVLEERKKEIVEKLIGKGFKGESISYEKFKELYKPYQKEMGDKEFAEILGIGYANYQNLKSGRQNARILKEKAKGVSEERKKEIVEELIGEGYKEKSISYEQFKELYKPYQKEMEDKEFVEILGIGYANYQNLKSGRNNARILKEKAKGVSEERKKEIVEELIGEGYKGKSISYEKFKELYKPYQKEMGDKEFGEILGVKYGNYMALKSGRSNARILKEKSNEVPEERKKEIVEELIDKGYREKSISYEQLKKLYEPYQKEMIDKEFAEILGIGYSNYQKLKSERHNARILKEKAKGISEKRKKGIVERMIDKGYKGKLINYEEFKELYKPYQKEMGDKEFAKILSIGYANYQSLKSGRQNARILKEKAKGISEKRKKEIVERMIDKGYKGKLINYEEFKELYKPYQKEMGDKEFAEILGIGYANYQSLKSGKSNARILKTAISEMKYKIENGDEEYTKRDIEKISKQYIKTENDFLITAFGENYKIYKEILNKKGKVYVKKERMSNEFMEKYAEIMLNEIKNISYNDTDSQEEILYRIIDTGKYIEENAEDDKNIEKIIISEIKKIAREVQTQKYYEKISEKSLDADVLYHNNKGEKKEIIAQTKDEKVDIEKQINLKIDKENNSNIEAEKCIELMQEYVDEGKSREEIIELVSKKLNINKEKMLKIIKEELHRRIKIEQEYEL